MVAQLPPPPPTHSWWSEMFRPRGDSSECCFKLKPLVIPLTYQSLFMYVQFIDPVHLFNTPTLRSISHLLPSNSIPHNGLLRRGRVYFCASETTRIWKEGWSPVMMYRLTTRRAVRSKYRMWIDRWYADQWRLTYSRSITSCQRANHCSHTSQRNFLLLILVKRKLSLIKMCCLLLSSDHLCSIPAGLEVTWLWLYSRPTTREGRLVAAETQRTSLSNLKSEPQNRRKKCKQNPTRLLWQELSVLTLR